MPEVSEFLHWDSRKRDWDNVNEHSGTNLERRPYYYKIIHSAGETKILIISAVERKSRLHATDFLLLNRQTLEQLIRIARAQGVIC